MSDWHGAAHWIASGLAMLAAHELVHLAELRDGGDKPRNMGSEGRLHLRGIHAGVVDDVMQQRGSHRQLHPDRSVSTNGAHTAGIPVIAHMDPRFALYADKNAVRNLLG